MKMLKNGKLSFPFPQDLRQLLFAVLDYRLGKAQGELADWEWCLIQEAKQSLKSDARKLQMRPSELFITLSHGIMQHVEPETQVLIRAHLKELPQVLPGNGRPTWLLKASEEPTHQEVRQYDTHFSTKTHDNECDNT